MSYKEILEQNNSKLSTIKGMINKLPEYNEETMPTKTCTNVVGFPGDGIITVKWRDPVDTILSGININEWSGTKLVINTNRIPLDETDGIVIVDNKVRDQYEINGYTVTNLNNNQPYYFALFPYTVNGVYNIDTTLQSGILIPNNFLALPKALNECTPLEIQAVAEAGYRDGNSWKVDYSGSTYTWFSLEDTIDITLTTNETITMVLSGLNHDTLSDNPERRAPFTFIMKDCLNTKYKMHDSGVYNTGGWDGSSMRSTLNTTIFDTLPEEWKNVIKSVTKKSTIGNKSSIIKNSEDKLWLPSESEIFSVISYGSTSEGEKYPVYSDDSTLHKAKKSEGIVSPWFLRSCLISNNTGYVIINDAGYKNIGSVNILNGISFGFCVA